MKRVRVYQLNTFFGVKSTGRIAWELARLVEREGGACRVGYGVPGVPAEAERFAYRVGTPVERKLHAAMRKLLDAEGYGSAAGTRALIEDMRAFAPQVVHLHNLHGCYLHLPTLFAYLREAKMPVVWTLHDCWPFTGHCAYFDYAQCEKWKIGCHCCPQQRSYPVCVGLDGSRRNWRRKRELFASLERITFVAPCQWMLAPLKASYLGQYPAVVIPNGVNLNAFQPTRSDLRARYGLVEKKIALAVASEWDERKGLCYLAELAGMLGDAYRVVAIGVSAEQKTAVSKGILGIQHTQDVHELAAWYTAADCFVNPTMEDNMPMVNLEALACGTPVAAFDTGGCAEAVGEDGGLIVPKGNARALAQAVRTLCERKPRFSAACVARARERFDCEAGFRAYLKLYEELCQ